MTARRYDPSGAWYSAEIFGRPSGKSLRLAQDSLMSRLFPPEFLRKRAPFNSVCDQKRAAMLHAVACGSGINDSFNSMRRSWLAKLAGDAAVVASWSLVEAANAVTCHCFHFQSNRFISGTPTFRKSPIRRVTMLSSGRWRQVESRDDEFVPAFCM